MTTDLATRLRPILAAYRMELEPAWSPETAHPDYEGVAGSPVGQCGVTSAWLQRRLREDHGREAVFTEGMVYAGGRVVAGPHCWLECGVSSTAVVIDVTAGQFPEIGRDVVCDWWGDLYQGSVVYEAWRYLDPEQVEADPVQARLAILTAAVGR